MNKTLYLHTKSIGMQSFVQKRWFKGAMTLITIILLASILRVRIPYSKGKRTFENKPFVAEAWTSTSTSWVGTYELLTSKFRKEISSYQNLNFLSSSLLDKTLPPWIQLQIIIGSLANTTLQVHFFEYLSVLDLE